MVVGILVYSAARAKEKVYMQQIDMWVKAFKGEGVLLKPVDSIRVKFAIKSAPEIIKFAFFYTRDISLAQEIEALNIPVINSAISCLYCDDKTISQARFEMMDVPTPKTFSVPPMTSRRAMENFGIVRAMIHKLKLTYPMVIKERKSVEGNGIFLVQNEKQLITLVKKFAPNGLLIQEYISDRKGLSYKVFVAGKKAYAGVVLYNKKDFRSNGPGGKMYGGRGVPRSAKYIAKKAAKACKTSIASVDIVQDKKGHMFVVGIDGSPETLEAERLTRKGITVKAAMYVVKNLKRFTKELRERNL